MPVFVLLMVTDHPRAALACFVAAMLSDALDGLLARLLNQRSKLGGVLDPVADKLLVFAALVGLLSQGRMPLWLIALVAFRDGMMIVGALVVSRKHLEIPTAPTRIGKYATFSLGAFVVLALTGAIVRSPLLDAYTAVVGFVAGLCVVISTIQYFARFGYLFFAPARSPPSDDAGRPQRV